MLTFIGFSEIVFILAVFFLLFGSKKIPEVARMLGKGIRAFRGTTDDIMRQISHEEGVNETDTERGAGNESHTE